MAEVNPLNAPRGRSLTETHAREIAPPHIWGFLEVLVALSFCLPG